MVKPSLRLLLLCTALIAVNAKADTVVLTSGETVNGTITYESESEIVISVNISSSIKDDRSIPRSEIESISKVAEDSKEFAAIANYKPGLESHNLAGYESLISSLERFIGKYPESEHLAEVKANLSALRDEKSRIGRGELKWGGRWFSVAQAQDIQYQYDAQKLFSQMTLRASRGDLIGALNAFEELETKFYGAQAFPEAVKLALLVIPKVEAELNRLVPIFRRQQEQFKESIHLVPEPEKTRLITANNATIAAAEAAVVAADRAKLKWLPLAPLSDKANTSIRAAIASEIPRLRNLPIEQMELSITLNGEIEELIKVNSLSQAEETLKRAQSLWPANQRLAIFLQQIKNKANAPAEAAPIATTTAPEDAPEAPVVNTSAEKQGD